MFKFLKQICGKAHESSITTIFGGLMSSSLTQGILVTIIGEAFLQDRLIQLLTKLRVSGYTIIPAQGAGSHGRRMGDMAGYNTNIEIKTIVDSETSDQLLENLKPLQATRALIAFRQSVNGLFD
jgi:nitrogen regulatory protein PII